MQSRLPFIAAAVRRPGSRIDSRGSNYWVVRRARRRARSVHQDIRNKLRRRRSALAVRPAAGRVEEVRSAAEASPAAWSAGRLVAYRADWSVEVYQVASVEWCIRNLDTETANSRAGTRSILAAATDLALVEGSAGRLGRPEALQAPVPEAVPVPVAALVEGLAGPPVAPAHQAAVHQVVPAAEAPALSAAVHRVAPESSVSASSTAGRADRGKSPLDITR